MRILIADDHDLVREAIALFLQQQDSLIITSVADVDQALEVIEKERPFDLVLLDYNMPGMNGLDGLAKVLAHDRTNRVALMSGEANRKVAEDALKLGAAGFVPKSLPAKSLGNTIKFMAMGEQYAPLDFMTAEDDDPSTHELAKDLTPRELQMLEGITQGKSNKQIALDFGITEPTVKLHVKTLYSKIGASNRTQAAIMARDAGLF